MGDCVVFCMPLLQPNAPLRIAGGSGATFFATAQRLFALHGALLFFVIALLHVGRCSNAFCLYHNAALLQAKPAPAHQHTYQYKMTHINFHYQPNVTNGNVAVL